MKTINNLLELAKQRVLNYDVDADAEFDKAHLRRLRSL